MKKIRVAAVNYLNTKPLLYGIVHHPVMEQVELSEGYPAEVARMLISDEADLGLIPIAAVTKLSTWHIVSDFCIGCDGPVASVGIFSDVPLAQVERVLLDYQSKTSVSLAKILIREYWKLDVELIDATGEDFRKQIKGNTAGVVIGDRALEQRHRSKYMHDLGEAWKAHTGLPFVFAAWISNKRLDAQFCNSFNEANALGLKQIDQVIAENPFSDFDLEAYYTRYIHYELNDRKREGMDLFLKKLKLLNA